MEDSIKEIAEIIKTLNLNLDSKTLQEITQLMSPYVAWWFIKDFTVSVLGFGTLITCVVFISNMVVRMYKEKGD